MQTHVTRGTGAFVAIAAFFLIVAPALGSTLPTELKIEKVLDTTGEVGDVMQAPDGALWVLERRSGSNNGVVRTYQNGLAVSTLNIPVSSSCDNGLMDVAFAPDYGSSGKAFVYYVDSGGDARVDALLGRGSQLGGNLITIGATTASTDGKCHAGGGMDIGADDKLYIGTGDLGVSANAQNPGSLAGKVLRADLDGSIPGDNASGTLVWARGFRDAVDLDSHPNGTIYVVDMGHDFNPGIDIFDELNSVHEGGNYGWPTVAQNGDDPLNLTDEPLIFSIGLATEGVEMLENSKLGSEYTDTVIYACKDQDDMRQAHLSGAPLDVLDSWNLLFDPDGDFDSTPDPGCPSNINALTEGRDGMLYGANGNTNSGVWRIYNDEADLARFPLRVRRSSSRSPRRARASRSSGRTWASGTPAGRISRATSPRACTSSTVERCPSRVFTATCCTSARTERPTDKAGSRASPFLRATTISTS